jgi:hypothetical protein
MFMKQAVRRALLPLFLIAALQSVGVDVLFEQYGARITDFRLNAQSAIALRPLSALENRQASSSTRSVNSPA